MSWEDDDDFTPDFSNNESKKNQWEEEDSAPVKPEVVVPATQPRNEAKVQKNPAKKAEEKEKASKPAPFQSDVLSERQKRQIVEASDLENAKGLFAGLDNEYKIDIINPKDEKDFEVLATTLADKLANYEKNKNYLYFVKSLTRKLANSLKADDVKDLASVLTAVSNEKLKAEKEKTKKKAPTNKKTQVKVSAKDAFEGVDARDDDEDDDDLDFM